MPITDPSKQLKSLDTPVNVIKVAVAVIHYGDRYLLGYRHAHQHQGNRYEFVGGKIGQGEASEEALRREVFEEIGMTLSKADSIDFIQSITHTYPAKNVDEVDKTVTLEVFNVALSKQTYDKHANQTVGLEGQKVIWIKKSDLLTNRYPLPEANNQILAWLQTM